jgi:hypothetical protein
MTDKVLPKEERPADVRVHYCRFQKSSGMPIMVTELGKDEYQTDNIEYNNVNVRVKFMNGNSKEKNRGATSILEIWKNV